MYMALASKESEVNTIEGSDAVADIAVRNFSDNGLKNIKVHVGSFKEKLPQILDAGQAPGLVFIDGDHRMDSLLWYFEAIAGKAEDYTVVVIDDIYLSPEMKEAWSVIKKHKKVSVTIDIYRFGIVFFRRGINNNHFIVRH
jgi:predicted O-methyltransferase YrrM